MKSILSNNLVFQITTPQSVIFGFWDLDTSEHFIFNYFLLIFQMYIYNARRTGYLNISYLLIYIKDIKETEKKLRENVTKGEKKNPIRNGHMF